MDTDRTEESVQKDNKSLRAEHKKEVDEATLPKNAVMSWSVYEGQMEAKTNKN